MAFVDPNKINDIKREMDINRGEIERVIKIKQMNQPWIDKLVEEFKNKIYEIVNVWVEIGVTNEKFLTRSNSLKQHVDNLLNDMLEEEHRHKDEVEKSIQNLHEEIKRLCSELKIDFQYHSNESLVKMECSLLTKKTELFSIKEDRMRRFCVLIASEKQLCERLFEYPLNLNPELVPTDHQLNNIANKIKDLECEKESRMKDFLVKRKTIIKYFSLLGKTPPKDAVIESIINDVDASYVPLSIDMLNQCDRIINHLKQEYQESMNECTKLRERYEMLSELLFGNDFYPSENYLSRDSDDFSYKTLNILKEEVLNLENCRLERLEEIIKQYQNKIREKLQKNFSSHLEKTEKYKLMLNIEISSESLLEQLENEMEKWNSIDLELDPLIKEMETWEKLYKKHIEINTNLKDPIVLKNRGGILLKVEKEKNVVRKELPKCEIRIREILSNLDESKIHASDLMINEMNIHEYVSTMWMQLEGEKENDRNNRKLKPGTSKVDIMKSSASSKTKPILVVDSQKSSSKLNVKGTEIKKLEINKALSKIPTKVASSAVTKMMSPMPTPKFQSKNKTNLDRRCSQSYNCLADLKKSKQLPFTGSTGDFYNIFCKRVKNNAVTSSFVESCSAKRVE